MPGGEKIRPYSFVMLFSPFRVLNSPNNEITFGWLITWTIMFHMSYAAVTTVYQAMMPEITHESERVVVSAYQNTANIIAAATGLGFALFLTGYLAENGGIQGNGKNILISTIIIFGIIEILIFQPMLIAIREKPVTIIKKRLVDEISSVLQNIPFKRYLIAQGMIYIGMAIFNSQILLFITGVLKLEKVSDLMLFGGVLFISVISTLVIWTRIGNTKGTRIGLSIGMIWLIISLPITYIIADFEAPKLVVGILFGIVVGIGLAAYYLFPYAIIGNLADADEKVTGMNRTGSFTGLYMVSVNIFQSLGLILASQITENLNLLGPIVAVFLLMALPIILKTTEIDPFLNDDDPIKTYHAVPVAD